MEAMVKERERTRFEEQKAKWTRREENEFLRVVSTYGVNYDRKKAQYDWTKFKNIAKFDKKTDADLTDYYMSFRAMLKKICNTKTNEDEGNLTHAHSFRRKPRKVNFLMTISHIGCFEIRKESSSLKKSLSRKIMLIFHVFE